MTAAAPHKLLQAHFQVTSEKKQWDRDQCAAAARVNRCKLNA